MRSMVAARRAVRQSNFLRPTNQALSTTTIAPVSSCTQLRRVSDVSKRIPLPRVTSAVPNAKRQFATLERGVREDVILADNLYQNVDIKVTNNHVQVDGKEVPNIWLRDNCQCHECIHEATRQRLLDTFNIPKDLAIDSAEVGTDQSVNITWNDGHQSVLPGSLLRSVAGDAESRSTIRQGLTKTSLWDSTISKNPPLVSAADINQGTGLEDLVIKIREHGFCYVEIPSSDGRDPDFLLQTTQDVLKKIAFIRETHYGGFYDFTADLASADTAYTNIALEAHTDNTYFSDPAGLQAFHLISHTDGEGGASLLVDGFKAAADLQKQDPKAYDILSDVNVYAHASGNDGISIQPYRGFPVLEHDPATGRLLRVRWNSSDRAGIELPIERVEEWYDAARKFNDLLKLKENEYWEQLVPGRILIFDNWRVMHGRSSFTGKRRICGAYINRDDWLSRFKIARFGQDGVLKELGV
ncbi:Trimethyllysine dioxygenase [Aaosphaeria arxii CBS 175.79]|uniref:Trimethyllysine dioxygenase n=1 Tax=Aaosphaeria arxii CBS 175.79 TaxID=1450172 RepID=A0A6A5XU66_9PLEO|nr:Trimethyllysine dioxygenase [Aaosphaeria arxii CBS 175.79]KAF2016251.1 Trimethyllysine dioxygenase [Aaosphaeria arxii CBS 175.79]